MRGASAAQADIERVPCSTPGSAPDLIARIRGQGTVRLLLLGHVDTVIGHSSHMPLRRDGDRLYGPGTVDMKGGVVLSLGVARALVGRADTFAEVSLLLVTDEEWRRHRVPPRGAVRRLRRLPVLRGRAAAARRATRAWSSSARRPGTMRVAGDRARSPLRQRPRSGPQRAAGAGRHRDRGGAATRPGWAGAPERGADDPALGRRVQRGAGGGRAAVRHASGLERLVRGRARRRPARARRGRARGRDAARVAGHGLARGHARAARAAPARGWGARSSACPAAAPAMPATSRPASR